MLKKLSQREKILLIVLVPAVVAGCFYYFLLTPQMKAYAQVKNDLSVEKQKLTLAQATVNSLKEETDKLSKIKYDVKCTGKRFSVKMTDGSDILFLGIRSASQDIYIKYIEPGDIKENSHSLELPLKVIVQGNYRNLLEFCKDIDRHVENQINLAEIRSLKIESLKPSLSKASPGTGSSAEASDGMVTATLNLVIYSAKTPDERLRLEQIAQWLIGRYDIFRPAALVAPIPELAGQLHESAEPGSVSQSATSQQTGSAAQMGSAGQAAGAAGSGQPLISNTAGQGNTSGPASSGNSSQSAQTNRPTLPAQPEPGFLPRK